VNNCGNLPRHKASVYFLLCVPTLDKKYADVCIFLVNERRRLVRTFQVLSDVAFLVPVVTKKINISESSSETGAKDRPPSYGGQSKHAKFITQLYLCLDVHDVFAAFSCRIKVSSLRLQS